MNTVSLILAFVLAQAPSRVSLFIYSRDSIHGLKDETLEIFRRELGKHAEPFAEIAYSRIEARVGVQFLGPGELTVEIGEEDEPARYLFRSDERASKSWALVRIGKFSKEFGVEGQGQRDLSRLAKEIASFLEQNAAAIK